MGTENSFISQTLSVVVAGIVKDCSVLLLKRNKEPYKDLWSLPGGKIEYGEFASEAIKREVLEETSLELSSIKYMGVVCEKVMTNLTVFASHLIMIFLCEPYSQNIVISDEGLLQWYNKAEIADMENIIIPTDFKIINDIIFEHIEGMFNCNVRMHDGKYYIKDFIKAK